MSVSSPSSEKRQGIVSFVASLPIIRRLKIIKELFLEKLDFLNQKTDSLLKNDTPLLQASLAITKGLKSLQGDVKLLLNELSKSVTLHFSKLEELDSKLTQVDSKLTPVDGKLTQVDSKLTPVDGKLTQVDSKLTQVDSKLTQVDSKLTQQEQVLDKVLEILKNQSKILRLDDGLSSPEVGLMCYLYSYLPNRRVIDIGANIGETSKFLLNTGYEVYAFEPFPSVFKTLNEKLGSHPSFHSFQIAIGEEDKSAMFHIACDQSESGVYKDSSLYNSLVKHSMPDNLSFVDTISVNVRSLESLRNSQEIPTDIALVKIDTEGYDLEVIRGMGEYRYPVVITEFWDSQFPFGRFGAMNQLAELVKAMKAKDYNWYIVIYQVWGNYQFSFYCNYPQSVDNSWGNVFFFKDYEIFTKALMWCSSTMCETYITSG